LYLPLAYMRVPAYNSGDRQSGATQRLRRRLTAYQPVVLPVVRQEELRMTARACSLTMPVLLVVEDDPHYGRVLLNLARDRGFKVLVAKTGADALVAGRASTAPRRSPWTCSCRTCSAGQSSIS
jgi:hypothetical protein